ncbi:hypothetical protein [Kalamiella sp. sgz302252]|uniref:hypothetical protein n=1 Tax=Pantoea sp. sgz302252 TaxID=3341827 RepID=UPI0036D3C255
MKNDYCDVNSISSFPKWTFLDVALWKGLPNNSRFVTGESRLWAYKAAWLHYNRDRIINYAEREKIPVLLLAGVAITEVAGTPERFKAYGVLQFYQLRDYFESSGNTISNKTSVGSIAIQLRAAAEVLNIDASKLTTTQQLQLANCLLGDDFNIDVAAKHLKSLILFDNPGLSDAREIDDELIMLAASRYNRGIERKKEDFISSLRAPVGSLSRKYTSYGRSMIEKKDTIMDILGVDK